MPLQLNELGRKIAEELHAHDWTVRTAPSIVTAVAGKEPFEIHEFAEHYISERLDRELEREVARSAYEHGMERHAVRAVLQVVLRDELIRVDGDRAARGQQTNGE